MKLVNPVHPTSATNFYLTNVAIATSPSSEPFPNRLGWGPGEIVGHLPDIQVFVAEAQVAPQVATGAQGVAMGATSLGKLLGELSTNCGFHGIQWDFMNIPGDIYVMGLDGI